MKPYGDLSAQPAISGNANFWKIYGSWFGDPTADSGRLVYRFFNPVKGTYLYTASLLERYRLIKAAGTWKYQGAALSWNPNSTANGAAVYRFRNKKSGSYLFTPSVAQFTALRKPAGAKKWAYEGVAFRASTTRTGAVPVYSFVNKKTGLFFFTASAAERAKFGSWTYRTKGWGPRGVGFWMTR